MGKAATTIREIRYVYEDSAKNVIDGLGLMHIYIYTICTGDCPHFVTGWYHKVFPATASADDEEVRKSVSNYLTEFDRGAPPK